MSSTVEHKLLIHDTTLRDGEQGIGNIMTLAQKAAVLEQLNRLPFDFIEVGFPAASDEDMEWARLASTLPMKAKPVVLVRPVAEDITKTLRVTEKFPDIHYLLLGTGSEIHQEKKRRLPLPALLDEIEGAATLLRSAGRNDISVILEDATRGSPAFLREVLTSIAGMGIAQITLADTVGCAIPDEIEDMFHIARDCLNQQLVLGIHCHNDLGLATANSMAAVSNGARLIQGTMGGLGERAGNCALEEVLSILEYKKRYQEHRKNFDLRIVHEVAYEIHRIIGKTIAPTKPLLGEHVFSTAAGIHQNGILKDPEVYEYVRPSDFGRQRKLVFNRLSGRTLLNAVLDYPNDADIESFNRWLLQHGGEFDANDIQQAYAIFQSDPQHGASAIGERRFAGF